jgi:uncharacterized delta-60 repeat protein
MAFGDMISLTSAGCIMFGTKKSKFKKRRSIINRKLTCEQLGTRAVFDAGDLDLSFGNAGVVTEADVSTTRYDIQTIQRDHKLLVRTEDNVISRFLSDGKTVDTSFGTNGSLTIQWPVESPYFPYISKSLELPNGKLLVVARLSDVTSPEVCLKQFNNDGSVDTSFGTNGTLVHRFSASPLTNYLRDVEVQSNGKILFAALTVSNTGSFPNPLLFRLNENGSLDTTFGTNGYANLTSPSLEPRREINDITLDRQGRIIVTGSSYYSGGNSSSNVFRFTPDGQRDNSFDNDGLIKFRLQGGRQLGGVAVQNDSKIILTVYNQLIRLNTNGSFDSTFSDDGILEISQEAGFARSPLIQADGKILVGLNSQSGDVYRFDTNGALDITFAEQGILNISTVGITNLKLQSDGRLLVGTGGVENFSAARYDTGSTQVKTKIIKGSTGNIVVNDVYGQDNNLTISRTGNNLVLTENTLDPTYRMALYNLPEATLAPDGKSVTIPLDSIVDRAYSFNVKTGSGNDKVSIDTDGDTTDSIPYGHALTVDLGADIDTFDLYDNSTDNNWVIQGGAYDRVALFRFGFVRLNNTENYRGGAGVDTFNVYQNITTPKISLNGEFGGADNRLLVINNGDMTLENRQLVIDPVFAGSPTQIIDLSYIQAVSLVGGSNNNRLDAAAFTLGSVDMLGGAGDDLLIGGSQGDWLHGGSGNDILRGNGGRDILIGGAGRDKLNQAAVPGTDLGEDILIGGHVAIAVYNNRQVILAAWNGAGTFDERIELLKITGVGPNNVKLNATTVIDDNAVDQLFGGSGNDWFFAHTTGTNQDTHDATATELAQLVTI